MDWTVMGGLCQGLYKDPRRSRPRAGGFESSAPNIDLFFLYGFLGPLSPRDRPFLPGFVF